MLHAFHSQNHSYILTYIQYEPKKLFGSRKSFYNRVGINEMCFLALDQFYFFLRYYESKLRPPKGKCQVNIISHNKLSYALSSFERWKNFISTNRAPLVIGQDCSLQALFSASHFYNGPQSQISLSTTTGFFRSAILSCARSMASDDPLINICNQQFHLQVNRSLLFLRLRIQSSRWTQKHFVEKLSPSLILILFRCGVKIF